MNFNSLDVNTQILAINDIYNDFYSYCINDIILIHLDFQLKFIMKVKNVRN